MRTAVMRMLRGGLITALAGTAALSAATGFGGGARPARAAVSLGVANGTANAAADHVAAGTSTFPNFKDGAIDSWIPLAHTHVDNSPFAEGTSSPLDTGPLGQTAAGAASKPQPQYADARFPKAGTTSDTVGSPGGPYAHASAASGTASAVATLAGGAPAPAPQDSGRRARLAALEAALGAWRERFLTPLALLAYPPFHPDASEPDGVAAGTVTTTVSIDPVTGLVDGGDARVASASFGGGSVLIRGLHVHVDVTNGGTPHQTSVVDLGEVTVGGMPVSVGGSGVTLPNGRMVPADQLGAATQQLNDALAKGGLTLRAVSPAVTSSNNQVTVDATGLHVDVQQPPTAPGVPAQFLDHTVGEVFANSLAVPAAPLDDLLPLLPGIALVRDRRGRGHDLRRCERRLERRRQRLGLLVERLRRRRQRVPAGDVGHVPRELGAYDLAGAARHRGGDGEAAVAAAPLLHVAGADHRHRGGTVVVARRGTGRLVTAVLARLRHQPEPQAVCPVDQWAFTPRYTEGRCPLCDWEAPGGEAYAGRTGRDLFWPGMAVLLLVSLVMGILVVLTYLRS